MNNCLDTNKSKKYEILCYGDSNTWGTVAKWHEEDIEHRYDRSTRWTCVLQNELGDEYAVNEEGLGGRTTIYTAQPENPHKNGMHMFEGCLASHRPLDLVIIYLGTNDIHQDHKLPDSELGVGIKTLVEFVKTHPKYGPGAVSVPEVLIISPTVVLPSAPEGRTEVYAKFFCEYGERQSRMFPKIWQNVASECKCYYLNAQDYAQPDKADGVHITSESHIKLGKAIAKLVREIRQNGNGNRA